MDFALERYFARWEFAVRHQLSASDVEAFTLPELLTLADDDAEARWNALSLGYGWRARYAHSRRSRVLQGATADDVSKQLAERESTLIFPGSVVGYDTSHFRLGLGRRNFPVALERLAKLLSPG